GATQARSAAAALNRVYPIRYATTHSGAERDMARVRGVLPADGSMMRSAVVAALSGDQISRETLRTELVSRRQLAAEALAFERAAAIQSELDGLDWVME